MYIYRMQQTEKSPPVQVAASTKASSGKVCAVVQAAISCCFLLLYINDRDAFTSVQDGFDPLQLAPVVFFPDII